MKKCNSCNTEFADTLDFCPECGSKDFGTVEEAKEEAVQPIAEEIKETAETAAEEEKAPEQTKTTEATDEAEAAEEEEPVPVVGLIIAGVIGLIILGVGLYFKLRH